MVEKKLFPLKFCPWVFGACVVWIVRVTWLVYKFISKSSWVHSKMQVEFMDLSSKVFFHLIPIKQWVLQQQYFAKLNVLFVFSVTGPGKAVCRNSSLHP